MRMTYKGNDYELTELKEPNRNESFDIIAIFRVDHFIWVYGDLVKVSKEEYEKYDEHLEKLRFVDYFYGADDEDENLIEMAKEYIDKEER